MKTTTPRKATTYTKEQALKHWQSLPTNTDPLKHMEPLPYKSEGSTYGACGIRIDGTPEFIDAVLGRLKDLIQAENGTTRLGLSRRAVTSVDIKGERKCFANQAAQAEVCYIRRHMRGDEAQILHAVYGSRLIEELQEME